MGIEAMASETAGIKSGTTKPLTLFEGEKHLLRRLPDVPVQLAVWTPLKLHGDCHVRLEKVFYSAPCQLVHQWLGVKGTDTTVQVFRDLELVAVHPRLRKPGPAPRGGHMPEAIASRWDPSGACARRNLSAPTATS
jgi:hypothetical protein